MSSSKLVLGTAQLGQAYGIANSTGKPDTSTAYKILETAFRNGITTIDTAHFIYGDSEKIIGDFISKENILFNVITKVPSFRAVKLGKDIMSHLKTSFDASLNNLKVPSIYGVLLHDINDFLIYKDECLEFFARIKKSGTVKKTGLSLYSPIKLDDSIDIVQSPFNIWDQRALSSGMIGDLLNNGKEFHARSIYLQGLFLLPKDIAAKKLPHALEYLTKNEELCKKAGISAKELAFAFARDAIGKGSIVVGAETPEQLLENIKLLKSLSLSVEIKADIIRSFKDVPENVIDPSKWGK